MKSIGFDFNNMFSHSVGAGDGVTESDVKKLSAAAAKAMKHIFAIINNNTNRIGLGLEWARLPFQDKAIVSEIQKMGDEIAGLYENVISLGIGGSYLGLKAAQDALRPAYYNDFAALRNGRPRVYFDGNNMDPDTLTPLLRYLDPKKTFVVVISKSGETTETKAAFALVEAWLEKGVGNNYGRQVFAITDPTAGTLRRKVDDEQARDGLGFRSLSVMKGVGGRFSELNIGLLHLAIVGVDIQEVLDGAARMSALCSRADIFSNPAAMYAMLHTILYRKKGKPIAVLMPFSERLKSTADWYVQLLAESLGKKFGRKVMKGKGGIETWVSDKNREVNIGRTPIPSRGTNDLHSIQQNNIEGENNKVTTFIRVDRFQDDIEVAGTNDFLEGKRYSELLSLAQEATEWALVREKRPSCAIIMPAITPYYWGELLFFFEMATAIEGELLGINAFDQPGVEGYKNYMYYRLGKPGIAQETIGDIKAHPLVKKARYML